MSLPHLTSAWLSLPQLASAWRSLPQRQRPDGKHSGDPQPSDNKKANKGTFDILTVEFPSFLDHIISNDIWLLFLYRSVSLAETYLTEPHAQKQTETHCRPQSSDKDPSKIKRPNASYGPRHYTLRSEQKLIADPNQATRIRQEYKDRTLAADIL